MSESRWNSKDGYRLALKLDGRFLYSGAVTIQDRKTLDIKFYAIYLSACSDAEAVGIAIRKAKDMHHGSDYYPPQVSVKRIELTNFSKIEPVKVDSKTGREL